MRIYFGVLFHTNFYKTRGSNWRSIGANLSGKKNPTKKPNKNQLCVSGEGEI